MELREEPTTATLTVKKQVFGCGDFDEFEMDCDEFQNNSPGWLDCNNNPSSVIQYSVNHYQRVSLISRYWMTKMLEFSNLKAQNKEQ